MDKDKKEILKDAFNEAWSSNTAMLSGDLKKRVIFTTIRAILERDFVAATDAEINEAINEGLEELLKAAEDFKHQHKMML